MDISPSAISRILNKAGFWKASTRQTYGTGYLCVGWGQLVQIFYTPRQIDDKDAVLAEIMETINGRKDRKYVAVLAGDIIEVRLRVEEPEEDAAVEKLAEESAYGVSKAEVRRVLSGPCYAFTDNAGGFEITREPSPSDRLVRVTYRDHSFTTYGPETGGREAYAQTRVQTYAKLLVHAGYSCMVDHNEQDGWSVVVGRSGEFTNQSLEEQAEDIQAALAALRMVVEAKALSYMTRRAGDHSLFVYFLIPFKDKLRRMEVFYSDGAYSSYGRFGGPRREFLSLEPLVNFIHSEIGE